MVIAKLNAANLIPNKVAPRYIEEKKIETVKKGKKDRRAVIPSKSIMVNAENRQDKLIEKLPLPQTDAK